MDAMMRPETQNDNKTIVSSKHLFRYVTQITQNTMEKLQPKANPTYSLWTSSLVRLHQLTN